MAATSSVDHPRSLNACGGAGYQAPLRVSARLVRKAMREACQVIPPAGAEKASPRARAARPRLRSRWAGQARMWWKRKNRGRRRLRSPMRHGWVRRNMKRHCRRATRVDARKSRGRSRSHAAPAHSRPASRRRSGPAVGAVHGPAFRSQCAGGAGSLRERSPNRFALSSRRMRRGNPTSHLHPIARGKCPRCRSGRSHLSINDADGKSCRRRSVRRR